MMVKCETTVNNVVEENRFCTPSAGILSRMKQNRMADEHASSASVQAKNDAEQLWLGVH